jgi:hypothetical protein
LITIKASFVNGKYLYYMSLKNIIRRVLKEQDNEWVDIAPEDYIDLLKYVNGDGALIKRLPDYRGKKIKITGKLDLSNNKEISNIDSIDYVDGDLNIGYTNIKYFDKNKVKGRLDYWYSAMYNIERKKILQEKLNVLQEYRENKEWDIDNGDDISYETEALFNHLSQNGDIGTYDNEDGEEVKEDKYFIYKTKYGGYGNSHMFEWLGDSLFESEWVVYSDDDIESAAYEKIKSDIEDLGYEAFGTSVWENNLDMVEVRRWLYDIHEDQVRNDPDDYGIEKELSQQQEKYLVIYTQKIERLNYKLENEELTDEETEEIEEEITSIEDIIEEIKEDPEGDYDEDTIEEVIDGFVEENSRDFPSYLEDMGFDSKYLLEFVDIDGVCEDILRDSDYGEILNGYDGADNEIKVNDKWYHVMRHN